MADRAKKYGVEFRTCEADDIRAFYDAHALRVWHLRGKDRVFRSVRVEQVVEKYGKDEKTKAGLWLARPNGEPVRLPFVCNPTNRDTIRGLYGNKPQTWVGKMIQLYPTTTESPKGVVDCIRVRNFDPEERRAQAQQGGAFVNRQGVNVLPSKPQQPEQQPANDPSDEPSGLELDLDDEDRAASRRDYIDATEDDEEPPPGALETDRVIG